MIHALLSFLDLMGKERKERETQLPPSRWSTLPVPLLGHDHTDVINGKFAVADEALALHAESELDAVVTVRRHVAVRLRTPTFTRASGQD